MKSVLFTLGRSEGAVGLYRGIVPGSISVFSRNGAAMIVLSKLNEKIEQWGLRE